MQAEYKWETYQCKKSFIIIIISSSSSSSSSIKIHERAKGKISPLNEQKLICK